MEEMTDQPLYRDRVCGIDIGKAGMVATIRVPSERPPARRATRPAASAPLGGSAGAAGLAAVLAGARGGDGGHRGLLEGPVYRLEAEGFECALADARQVKNLPGLPKRDPADSRWLAACFERGAVTAVLRGHAGVPGDPAAHPLPAGPDRRADPGEAAGRRSCWNRRRSRSPPRSSPDLHGVTGRDIMDHLIAGERNPKVLAQLARRSARRKISPAGRGAGRRGVLHRRPRRPARHDAGPASTGSTRRSPG